MELWTKALCFLCLFATCFGSSAEIYNVIESHSFDTVKSSKPIVVISFLKSKPYDARFHNTFREAGDYLQDFGVHLGTVNCLTDAVPEFCEKAEAADHVYIFSHSDFLTLLPYDTLFGMDAIVSNVLHMALLVDVPIMSEDSELEKLENENRGKKDIVFGYIPAVGTHADRAFIEVAFTYRHIFTFAMTTRQARMVGTDNRTSSLSDEAVAEVWTLQCSTATPSEPCRQAKYRGPITTEGVALMLKILEQPALVDVTSKGQIIPYPEYEISTVYAVTDPANHEKALAIVMETKDVFRGNIGFVVIDRDYLSDDKLISAADANCEPACFVLQAHTQEVHSPLGTLANAEDLKAFLEMNIDRVFGHLDYPVMEEHNYEEKSEDDYYEELPVQERQDDRVQAATVHLRIALEPEEIKIPSLTDKTFPEFTGRSQLTTILFTIRWNPRCLAFLGPFESAADNIVSFLPTQEGTSPLATVECASWPDVCDKNNVTFYPTVKMYRGQSDVATYRGVLDEENILKAHMLHALPNPVEIDTVDNLKSFTQGMHHGSLWMKKYLTGVMLAVIPDELSEEKSTFVQVARELTGQHLLGLCTGQCAKQVQASASSSKESLPSLVAYKWRDPHQPDVAFREAFTVDNLLGFIAQSSLPVLPELTPASMPTYMARQKPFVILFNAGDPISDKAAGSLRTIAADDNYNQLVLCQMDISHEDSLGKSTLTTYGFLPLADAATVVILDHAAGAVCRYPHGKDSDEQSLKTWLKSALAGRKDCSEMRALVDREWQPLVPPYDYLKFIENEEHSTGSGRRGIKTHLEMPETQEGGADDHNTAKTVDTPPRIPRKDNLQSHQHTEL